MERKMNLKSNLNKTIKVFVLASLISASIPMNAQVLPTGKSTSLPTIDPKEKPYSYIPVDPEYWQRTMQLLKDKNYLKVIEEGFALGKEYGAESDDAFEGLLAVGMSLRHQKLYYAATLVFSDIIRRKLSTELAQKALFELNLVGQESYLDEVDVINDLLNSNEFGDLHPDIQSFVSYHVSLSDLIAGFKDWGLDQASKVQESSFWGQKTSYLKALSEISQGRLDRAEARLTKLLMDPSTHPHFINRSKLHVARISFEKKDFIKSSTIYRSLSDFPLREKARIMLERAWSFYYLKNYSEALGVLTALRAPIFEVSATPERFILEMIIYKQLCYYDKVNEVAREYYNFFGSALRDIKKRRDLKSNPTLAHMALANMRVQEQANFINQLRDELQTVKDIDLAGYSDYFKSIESDYINKEKEVSQRLYFLIDQQMPLIAEEVLDSEEQVKFLDFTAKLDALRIIRRGEDRDYKTETISFINFNSIYWPVENEFWLDEIDDYRVLLRSQCDLSLPSASEDEGIIKQFGEEFK